MSDKPSDSASPQPGSGPVKAAQIGAEPPPAPKKSFLQRLFDPETRLGRGMRAFTRVLGAVVGLFALGLMSAYVLLYQPIERRYRAVQTELTHTVAALETLQGDLKLAQTSLAGSEQERKSASTQLEKLQANVAVQRAKVKVVETRLALAQKDSAAARLALGDAEKLITALKPDLETSSSQSLEQVLALVKSDITRDASLADQDLQRLLSELELIGQGLE